MPTAQLNEALRKCTAGVASRVLGVSTSTLLNWHKRGILKAERTPTGKLRYDLAAYLEQRGEKAAS